MNNFFIGKKLFFKTEIAIGGFTMAYKHGVYIQESPTPLVAPVAVDSAMPIVIGAAPAHKLADPSASVNFPFLINNYGEGVSSVGYSDDWSRFTLSEVLYSQFRLHNVAPIVLINVWNPETDATDAAPAEFPLINRVATITDTMAMFNSVVVTDGTAAAYVKDTDYTLSYDGDRLLITVIPGGAIPPGAAALTVGYKKATTANLSVADIEGGVDLVTNARKGIELADEVFLRYQKNAGFIMAPGFSENPQVAALLAAKAESLNGGNFSCIALLDMPTDGANSDYRSIPQWKNDNGYNYRCAFGDWPSVAIGERVFHASTRLAAMYGEQDNKRGGYPYAQASNKPLAMTKICESSGTEIPMLDQPQANFLNENGIGTFLNWGGWRAWGDETLAFPGNTDIKDYERSVRRMFCWVQNTVNRTIWQKVDAPITRILIDSVLLAINTWFNTLKAEGAILGGRCVFLRGDNTNSSLISGRIFFRVYLTPPNAAKDITFDFQYDPDYLDTLFE
jgi:phage tail sheath protein FI